MDHMIYTLHDFMLHTENITYIIMGISLTCAAGFWLFLTREDRDEDNKRNG